MVKIQRIAEIDIAKGILIFFVILGHSPIGNWLASGIGSFHMAGFFLLSGFTYNYKSNIREFFVKKSKSLLFPYLRFSVILLILATLKHLLHIGLNNYNLRSGIESIFIPYSGREYTTVYFLWFLPCLFLVEVLMACSQYVSEKLHNHIVGGGILALCSMACVIIYIQSNVPSIISILPIGLLFFLIGVYGKPYLGYIKERSIIIFVGFILLFGILVFFNSRNVAYNIDLSSMCLGCWHLYLLSSLCGTLAVISLSTFASLNILQWLGRNSLYYYGLHFCVIWITDSFLSGILCAVVTIGMTTPLVVLYQKIFNKKI